jgi:hypothetical protein
LTFFQKPGGNIFYFVAYFHHCASLSFLFGPSFLTSSTSFCMVSWNLGPSAPEIHAVWYLSGSMPMYSIKLFITV